MQGLPNQLESLFEMFPTIDRDVIGDIYQCMWEDVQATAESLMALDQKTDDQREPAVQ